MQNKHRQIDPMGCRTTFGIEQRANDIFPACKLPAKEVPTDYDDDDDPLVLVVHAVDWRSLGEISFRKREPRRKIYVLVHSENVWRLMVSSMRTPPFRGRHMKKKWIAKICKNFVDPAFFACCI